MLKPKSFSKTGCREFVSTVRTAFKRKFNTESAPGVIITAEIPKILFYAIEAADKVRTEDGWMVPVSIRHNVDLNDPSHDVAAIIGKVLTIRKSGYQDPSAPDIWFWNDKMWLKAVHRDGNDYYLHKTFLFYEVEIENRDDFLANCCF